MATNVNVNFEPIKVLEDMGLPNGARVFLANEIVKLSDPYVPFRDGYLKNSVQVLNGGRQISYGGHGASRAYARRWYYEPANFNGAPTRGNRWVERAVASNSKQIISTMQNGLKRGLFK